MDLVTLRGKLCEIDTISNQTWMDSLDERKREELRFHDAHRDRHSADAGGSASGDTYEKFYGNRKYYAVTKSSVRYLHEWIAEKSPGRVVLDYACGNGEMAIRAAKAGASLAIGLDISRVSVENARRDAAAAGVSANTYFVQADAENTRLPPDSVDVVICSGMLHHLDLSYAFPELRRVLAPGGRILAAEALDYNPAIKLYRALTPAMRTRWERSHILSLHDIEFARRFFDIGDIRYWHVIGYLGAHVPSLSGALDALDGVLTRIPGIRLMAWIFYFELLKKDQIGMSADDR